MRVAGFVSISVISCYRWVVAVTVATVATVTERPIVLFTAVLTRLLLFPLNVHLYFPL